MWKGNRRDGIGKHVLKMSGLNVEQQKIGIPAGFEGDTARGQGLKVLQSVERSEGWC